VYNHFLIFIEDGENSIIRQWLRWFNLQKISIYQSIATFSTEKWDPRCTEHSKSSQDGLVLKLIMKKISDDAKSRWPDASMLPVDR
jgi:hypothetical protein